MMSFGSLKADTEFAKEVELPRNLKLLHCGMLYG